MFACIYGMCGGSKFQLYSHFDSCIQIGTGPKKPVLFFHITLYDTGLFKINMVSNKLTHIINSLNYFINSEL